MSFPRGVPVSAISNTIQSAAMRRPTPVAPVPAAPAPAAVAPAGVQMGGMNLAPLMQMLAAPTPQPTGLLGTSFNDPRTQANLAAAGALLQQGGYSTTPTTLGQGLGAALQLRSKEMAQRQALQVAQRQQAFDNALKISEAARKQNAGRPLSAQEREIYNIPDNVPAWFDANGTPQVSSVVSQADRIAVAQASNPAFAGVSPASQGQEGAARPAWVPPAPKVGGGSQSVTNAIQQKAYESGLAALEKSREQAAQSASMIESINTFMRLNEKVDTGGKLAIPSAARIASSLNPSIAEMLSIQDKLTPLMRQGLPGAASDRDVRMFRGASFGVEKPREANMRIARAMLIQQQNVVENNEFRSRYFSANQTLVGADDYWREYIEANPIFDPNAPEEDFVLNENRMTPEEYFTLRTYSR